MRSEPTSEGSPGIQTRDERVAATALATRVMFGARGGVPEAGSVDEQAFAQTLVRNKAPVAVVPEEAWERALPDGWTAVRDLVARERRTLADAAGEYTRISSAWRDSSIEAVLIKSPGYFPYTSDNVDVLVSDHDAASARAALERLGYRELPWVREPFKILLRKVEGDPAGFAIHLHTRVAWINSFFEGAEVLRASRPFDSDGLLRRPGPESAFLITTAHWFYEDKEIKLRDLYHSQEILREDLDWDAVTAAAERGGWIEGLRSAVHLLKRAAGDLGIEPLASRLPEMPRSSSRLSPGFGGGVPVKALPAAIDRRKTKAMHFAKSVLNREATTATRAREVALVGAYAFKARFPALQRAPLFVVAAPADADVRASMRRAAATLRSRFSLPVAVHANGATPTFGMSVKGGIHVVGAGATGLAGRRGVRLTPVDGAVRVDGPAGASVTAPAGTDDELPLATAIARLYLEAIG